MAGTSPPAKPVLLGRFRGLVDPGVESDFVQGGMPTPDGGLWSYREPEAVVIVEPEQLRVRVPVLTRSHDTVQFFDNAKHMYFSRQRIVVPPTGRLAVEVGLSARVDRGRDDDLFSGFVSLNLLDFATGVALDWFLSNRRAATVCARLPFAGPRSPDEDDDPARPHWYCVFNEVRDHLEPGENHRCRIEFDAADGSVRYLFDGEEADRYTGLQVRPQQFLVALGIMTEKPIGAGGSVSCFGQGVTAGYSQVSVEGAEVVPDPPAS